MKKTVLLTIEYDGTAFHGWQRQAAARTVQGVLEEALSKVTGAEIVLSGVSRTDAGVHANGQLAQFTAETGIPTDRIPRAVNRVLRGRTPAPGPNADVRILAAEDVPEGFRIRREIIGKTYRYMIRNAAAMPVFLRNYRYLVTEPLSVEKMREAAAQITGTHDFACFQAEGSYERETTVRTIMDLTVTEQAVIGTPEETGRDIIIDVTGDGFLYNMVRIITGTLVEAGSGKIDPASVGAIIEGRDRAAAGHTAPPRGLWLRKVLRKEAGPVCPAEEPEKEAVAEE